MDYEQRRTEAVRLFAIPPKGDQKGQKFPRGARVKVANIMPPSMSHFERGFIGIVEYTYAQKYWGNDVDSYCLIVLDDNGKPINSIAWYKENQLMLVSDDIETGRQIIADYDEKRLSSKY